MLIILSGLDIERITRGTPIFSYFDIGYGRLRPNKTIVVHLKCAQNSSFLNSKITLLRAYCLSYAYKIWLIRGMEPELYSK